MTWPSLVVVICGLVFLRVQTRRHKLTLCGRRSTSSSQLAANDVVKQPLRQEQHPQQADDQHRQYNEDYGGDSDGRKTITSHNDRAAATSSIRPTITSPAAAADANAGDDLSDEISCEDDTESHATPPTPPLCYTSSASSLVTSSSHRRLQLVSSVSSPALDVDNEARRTDISSSRLLSSSHSAAHLAM